MNSNGQAGSGELRSLAELGIVELDLGATQASTVQNGNLIGLEGHYLTQDGRQHELADVWFGHASTPAPAAVPALSELLQPASPALLATPTSSEAGSASAHDTAVHSGLHISLMDQRLREHQEQLRQSGAWG